MKYGYLYILPAFMGLLLSVEAGSIDLTKGLDKARTSHLDGINQKTDDEFIPLKQGLKVDKTGLISFVVPGKRRKRKLLTHMLGWGRFR